MKTVTTICSVAGLLAGCGTPWPIEPSYDREVLARKGKISPPTDVDEAKKIASAWHADLAEAARDRRKQEIAASELLFYGTLLYTAAQASLAKGFSNVALYARNSGATAAGGSQLLISHYQPKDQRTAFRKAERQMGCLIDALAPVPTLSEWQLAFDRATISEVNIKLNQGAPTDGTAKSREIVSLYNAVPRQALHFIERTVIPNLQAELQEVTLGTPSREDIIAAADRYRADREAGAKAAAAVGPAEPAAPIGGSVGQPGVTPTLEQAKLDAASGIRAAQLTPEQTQQALDSLARLTIEPATNAQLTLTERLQVEVFNRLGSAGAVYAERIRMAATQRKDDKAAADIARATLRRKGAVEAISSFSSALSLCQPS